MMMLRWDDAAKEATVINGPWPVTLRKVRVEHSELNQGKDYWVGRLEPSNRAGHLHVHAAVHVDNVTGDIGGIIAGQELDRSRDVVGRARAFERDLSQKAVFDFLGQIRRHIRFNIAGRHGVYSNVPAAQFERQSLGEPDDASLGGDIVGLARIAL